MSIRQAVKAMTTTDFREYRWRCLGFVLLEICKALGVDVDHDDKGEP